jgi:hypothetical protein
MKSWHGHDKHDRQEARSMEVKQDASLKTARR